MRTAMAIVDGKESVGARVVLISVELEESRMCIFHA